MFYIWMARIIGLTISCMIMWDQGLISVTSTFTEMVNANKFTIIDIEGFGLHSKALKTIQLMGGSLAILSGVKSRQAIQQEVEERTSWLPNA